MSLGMGPSIGQALGFLEASCGDFLRTVKGS